MPTMTYLQAISDAMREEMRADERVFVMGEDIGHLGGAFKVTDGFLDEFGHKRVMDTPLAESAIVGTAIGAAVEGMRPIAEMQFADFISCGFDQLVNVAGKMYYRQGLSVNLTVRLPSGGGFSGGPFHSQNPEAWFMHSPGLKVVAPSTAEDAKGLLIKAVRDPNPVVFLEHKHLYRRVKGEVAEGAYETPFSARIAREGTDLTVIAYGAMVHTALEATQDIDGASIEADEIIASISTDKIDTDVESPATGRVTEILVEVGATVEVGTVMARIATDAKPGEAHASENDSAARKGTSEADVAMESEGDAGELQGDTGESHAGTAQRGTPAARRSGSRRYSPVVMRIAAEHDIDLEEVEGTGRGGRVRKQDVLAYLESGNNGAATEPPMHIESPYRPDGPAAPRKPKSRLGRPEGAPPAPGPVGAAGKPP